MATTCSVSRPAAWTLFLRFYPRLSVARQTLVWLRTGPPGSGQGRAQFVERHVGLLVV